MSFYFNGGPYFEEISQEGMSVLAWYEFDSKKLPAILYIKYGQGNVILSGVHFEYIPNDKDIRDENLKNIIPILDSDNYKRNICIRKILASLGIS